MVAAVYHRRSTTATRHSGEWGGGGSAGARSQLSQGEGGVTDPQQVTGLSQGHVLTHYSETVIHTQHKYHLVSLPFSCTCELLRPCARCLTQMIFIGK